MKNINGWSEAKVYQYLGQPRTASLQLMSGALPGPYAPRKVVDDIEYANLDEKWLTGNVRIIDFGEAFFLNNPRAEFLGTPASYFAPEMLFGRSASAASDVWALGCLIYEIQALRPLVYAFFGTMNEALAEIVQTLGPLPTAWRHSYYDKTHKMEIKPGQSDPWFNPSKIRHPLESLLCEVKPQLTAKEIASLLELLKGALEYEPSHRSSAKQIATHAWFA
jgi:serine/threonine protein kinase